MVNIDVTTGLTAGANAFSTAMGGLAEGQQTAFKQDVARQELDLARRQVAMRKQQANEERAFREQRLSEMTQRGEGKRAAQESYLRMRGRQFQYQEPVPTGSGSFFGDPQESTRDWAKDEMDQLEGYLGKQREELFKFAQTLSPAAAQAFIDEHLPLLIQEENDERQGVMDRQVAKRGEKLIGLGFLNDEEAAVVKHGIQGLTSGEEDARSVGRMLSGLEAASKKRFSDQKDMEWGMQYYSERLAANAQGGGDPRAISQAFADWATSKDPDPKQLKAAIFVAENGIGVDDIKIGSRKVKRDISPQNFVKIAGLEARKEARKMTLDDPEIASAIGKDKNWDADIAKLYNKKLRDNMRDVVEGYLIDAGIDPGMAEQLFPELQVPYTEKRSDASDAIRAGGGNPDAVIRVGSEHVGPNN